MGYFMRTGIRLASAVVALSFVSTSRAGTIVKYDGTETSIVGEGDSTTRPQIIGSSIIWRNGASQWIRDASGTRTLPHFVSARTFDGSRYVYSDGNTLRLGDVSSGADTVLTTNLLNPNPHFQLSKGHVAWVEPTQNPSLHGVFSHDGVTTRPVPLTSFPAGYPAAFLAAKLQMYGGTVAAMGMYVPVSTYDLVINGTPITASTSYDDGMNGLVAGNGFVAWIASAKGWPGFSATIYIFDGDDQRVIGGGLDLRASETHLAWVSGTERSPYHTYPGNLWLSDGVSATKIWDGVVTYTGYGGDQYDFHVHGDDVVWSSTVGGDSEIFLYRDGAVTQLTDNDYDDRYPFISGNTIVWNATVPEPTSAAMTLMASAWLLARRSRRGR